MKLFWVKVGKAWHVLRRDGFIRGGKRVWSAFLDLFQRVTPGDVLFITNGVGDSARYRTKNIAEMFQENGIRTAVTVQDNPFLLSYAEQFSVFVFHRALYTPKVARFIARLKELHKEVIFETDDLIYDPVFLQHMDYYQKMNALEKKLYEHGLGGEIVSDPYVRVATTTTNFLADELRKRGKQVFVVSNRLSIQDVAWSEDILASAPVHSTDVVRLCYLSGTPSHNKDFATITSVLVHLLEKYPQVCLVLAGPLDTDHALNVFAERIERVPFLPRREYFKEVATMDINLAPLEIDNPFCESKSELKWFEAGLVGVPTVAAATRTFREAITDGVDGQVAGMEQEWEEKLSYLIEHREARRQMGKRARQTALTRYTTKSAANTEYLNYLKAKL